MQKRAAQKPKKNDCCSGLNFQRFKNGSRRIFFQSVRRKPYKINKMIIENLSIYDNQNHSPMARNYDFDSVEWSESDLEIESPDFDIILSDKEDSLFDKASLISSEFGNAFFYAMRGIAVFPHTGNHTIEDATSNVEKVAQMWIDNPKAKVAIATGNRFGIVAFRKDERFWRMVRNSRSLDESGNRRELPHAWNDTWRLIKKSPLWRECENYCIELDEKLFATLNSKNRDDFYSLMEESEEKFAELGQDSEFLFFFTESYYDHEKRALSRLKSLDGFYGDGTFIVDDSQYWSYSKNWLLQNENVPPKLLPQELYDALVNNSNNKFNSQEPSSKSETPRQFPQIEDKAFYGVAGELVRLIEPHSEADPVALLAQLLAGFGSLIGRNAHLLVEADQHFTNINLVLVGESSKARKGTSWGQIKTKLTTIEPNWAERLMSGLSSGEGMIWQVRDPIEKRVKKIDKKTGEVSYEVEVIDPGVDDKRLLIFEGEFASVLNVAQREGNILSALIRNAWDTGNLSTLVKNSPNKATNAHISIIGHITRDELLRKLNATEQANGFANRFLWLCVKRSKLLPLGGKLQSVDFNSVVAKLRKAADNPRNTSEIKLNDEAIKLWCDVYPKLSEGKTGMLGAITSRGEAQTLRLALIYALLDSSAVIAREHLEAALAFWKYAEDSAQFIFGDALGDPVADTLMQALQEAADLGMTRTQIRDLFNRPQYARGATCFEYFGQARSCANRESRNSRTPNRPVFCC